MDIKHDQGEVESGESIKATIAKICRWRKPHWKTVIATLNEIKTSRLRRDISPCQMLDQTVAHFLDCRTSSVIRFSSCFSFDTALLFAIKKPKVLISLDGKWKQVKNKNM